MAQEQRRVEVSTIIPLLAELVCPDKKFNFSQFWIIATNRNFYLTSEEIKQLIDEIENRSFMTLGKICDQLKNYMSENNYWPDHCQRLIEAIAVGLLDDLQKDKKMSSIYNDQSLSYFMSYAYDICMLLTRKENMGLMQKIFRLFGEMASDELVQKVMDENPEMPKEFADALAAGAINRHGPHQVFETITRRTDDFQSKMRIVYKEVIAAQAEFRNLYNGKRDVRVALNRLQNLMGSEAAQAWVEENFPQTVGSSY